MANPGQLPVFVKFYWHSAMPICVHIKLKYAFIVSNGLPRQLSGKRICLPMQEMQVQSLDQEDPLEEGMATHSSILA